MRANIFEAMGQRMLDDGLFGADAKKAVVDFIYPRIEDDKITGYTLYVDVFLARGETIHKTVFLSTYKDVFEDFMIGNEEYIKRAYVT